MISQIFKTIVDVGGATGNMLAAVLSHHAGPRGILFDRPHVVKDAPALLDAKGVSDRVTIEPGDFFESVPTGRMLTSFRTSSMTGTKISA